MSGISYVEDILGTNSSNRITETIPILNLSEIDQAFSIPTYAPFYADTAVIKHVSASGTISDVDENVDFVFGLKHFSASLAAEKRLVGAIVPLKQEYTTGYFRVVYNTLGGATTINQQKINGVLTDILINPVVAYWEQVVGVPVFFTPAPTHKNPFPDMTSSTDMVNALYLIAQNVYEKTGGAGDTLRVNQTTATVTLDARSNNNFCIVASSSFYLAKPINLRPGIVLSIHVVRPVGVTATITFDASFKWGTNVTQGTNPNGPKRELYVFKYDELYDVLVIQSATTGVNI